MENKIKFYTTADVRRILWKNKELTVKELYEKIGTNVTSYNRKSCI